MAGFEVITVNEDAQKRLGDILASSDGAIGIRIGVKNAGCAGMEYTIDLVPNLTLKMIKSKHQLAMYIYSHKLFCFYLAQSLASK